MMYRIAFSAALAAGPATADIVVDLPIVGALVETVVDAPVTVLVEGQSDPHGLTLRPSQARALQDASLVVHLGSGFSPALERALADAGVPLVSLAELAGVMTDEHDDHADHNNHNDHADHDDHAEHDDHAGHAHTQGDPHVWLDYTLIDTWLAEITEVAAEQGLTLADMSDTNVAASIDADLDAAMPSPVPTPLVTHDIWSRLTETRGIEPFPVISDSHAAAPGAAHLAALRNRIEAGDVDCILAATGDPMSQAETLADEYGLPIVTVRQEGDPNLTGIARYRSVFTGFATALSECQANGM